MSKIKDFIFKEEYKLLEPKRKINIFKVRQKRKNPLHPNEISKRIKEKYNISKAINNSWKYHYGWLITLLDKNYVKHKRHTATYLDAVKIRDEELKTGNYIQAWIIEKTGESSI